ncbi:HEAT repeat domain-containing protein [Malonomonas rubra]|uniref:HEAT repeat domain-containing protein n=1 Tax=Malonomonas rubra TaxID=57040 RepID=UPI0026EE0C19|nr:HEAT repeat domain-containing protein [Malonomonas rubra]
MTSISSPHQLKPETDLLADFLHELNIARRSLTLYPPNHPQVAVTSDKTLERLSKLLDDRASLTLGIAPEALFFEHRWLDKEHPAFRSFATLLSGLGIASISFAQNLTESELIQFCQLLHSDRQTIEEHGGFKQFLNQQQIEKISIVQVDYTAFCEKCDSDFEPANISSDLWGDFLQSLQENILDLVHGGVYVAPQTIADLLNRKLASGGNSTSATGAIGNFVEQLLEEHQTGPYIPPANQLNELLEHLSPQLQTQFLAGTLQTLENHPELANQVLSKFSPALLEKASDPNLHQQLTNSPRLVELVKQFAANPAKDKAHTVSANFGSLDKEMVRARLDVLFSEERHNLYLPDNYQSALQSIFSTDITSGLPTDICQELKQELENQPVEEQCSEIIFDFLQNADPVENEASIQQNLIDLCHFFLDTGNFRALREIYLNWATYLNSGRAKVDILSERVLACQIQQSFIQEVINAIDIWGEEKAESIKKYISAVGQPYTEPVIKQLGLAKQFSRRRYWIEVLAAIGSDANQFLIDALNDERWYLVRNLLTVLQKNLAPPVLKAIQRVAGHPHPRVRQEVIRILLDCNPATANRMLARELSNPNRDVQLGAVELAGLSNAVDIINMLHEKLLADIEDHEATQEILQAMARIGHDSSLQLLKKLLARKGLFTPKPIKQLHFDIIRSIGKYPPEKAREVLRQLAIELPRYYSKLAGEQLRLLSGESP